MWRKGEVGDDPIFGKYIVKKETQFLTVTREK